MTMLCLPSLLLMIPIALSAQWQKKPYGEWSEKEAVNVLNNSPWGQTQEFADTTAMFDTRKTLDSGQSSRVSETARTRFRIRFFSAKPIRQATSRLIEIKQKGKEDGQLAARLKALVDADFSRYVVITLVIDTAETPNQTGALATILVKQITSDLKSETYLLATGGERVILQEYQPPRQDPFGARFIFPRTVDGKPIINPDSREVIFHTQLKDGPNFNMRFKVKDMVLDGKLEY
jgi:hypothetical protein